MTNPLLMASYKGSPGIVAFLLEKGADPLYYDDVSQNGLHMAAINDNVECFKVRPNYMYCSLF